jgi:hypothetical protein
MAFTKVKIKPGVNRDTTNYANEGGYYESEKVRFLSGYPQKLGGWESDPTVSIKGICRSLFNYITSNSDNILWIGTTNHLYAEVGGNLQDLTPARATFTSPASNNCFDTTNGSRIVNVNIVGHGVTATGQFVTFSGVVGSGSPATIGGIPEAEFNAEFQVYAIVDANNFQIETTTAATSTTSNQGGTGITAVFPIIPGNDIDLYGYGWSAGPWSRLGWGTGTVTPLVIGQRDWWYDNFDNDSVMNIRNGTPYYWAYEATISVRAIPMSTAATNAGFVGADVPAEVMQLMVSQNDRHLCAFGATPFGGGNFDPMLIRWATQGQPLNWTPTATNSAGFYRVSRGSRIVRAIPTRQETLILTDSSMYSMQFTGTTDVFAFQELADNISIASPRSIVVANNVAYWMGQDKFYMYSGRVETLPCTLRNEVFNNINFEQQAQIICGTNERWNEVWWIYPTGNNTSPDSYVIYNYAEQIWYYGTIERTAWLDSPLRLYPQAINGQYLYNHEVGIDADGLPMTSYIVTSDFDIVDGDEFLLIKRMIPDINFAGSTAATPRVLLTVKPRNFPGSNYNTTNQPLVELSSTVPVEQYTEQIFIRARARQMGLKIYSDELGVMWQMGLPRLDGRKDGKR